MQAANLTTNSSADELRAVGSISQQLNQTQYEPLLDFKELHSETLLSQ